MSLFTAHVLCIQQTLYTELLHMNRLISLEHTAVITLLVIADLLVSQIFVLNNGDNL